MRNTCFAAMACLLLLGAGSVWTSAHADPLLPRYVFGHIDIATFDVRYGILTDDWAAAQAALHAPERPDEPVEAALAREADELERLAGAGNIAAQLMWHEQNLLKQLDRPPAEREFATSISTISRIADRGSLSALVLLMILFSAGGEPWVSNLSPAAVRCWDVAYDHLNSIDENLLPPLNDPRLWHGRTCIAPTLEALRS